MNHFFRIRVKYIFLPLLLLGFFFVWQAVRPDPKLSNLNDRFSIGEKLETINDQLKENEFNNFYYVFKNGYYENSHGGKTASPNRNFAGKIEPLTSYCENTDCHVIVSRKTENKSLWIWPIYHKFHYIWFFENDQLLGAAEIHGFWSFSNK